LASAITSICFPIITSKSHNIFTSFYHGIISFQPLQRTCRGFDAIPCTISNHIFLDQFSSNPNIYVGSATIPAYMGDGTGWSFDVCTELTSYGEWGWGAGTQYLFDGTVAGFGQSSIIDVETATVYTFTYNATTHVTTYTIED